MKIYKLVVNEVKESSGAIISSYVSPRIEKKATYYADWEKAKLQQEKIYEAISHALGFIPNVEATIEEIEVIE